MIKYIEYFILNTTAHGCIHTHRNTVSIFLTFHISNWGFTPGVYRGYWVVTDHLTWQVDGSQCCVPPHLCHMDCVFFIYSLRDNTFNLSWHIVDDSVVYINTLSLWNVVFYSCYCNSSGQCLSLTDWSLKMCKSYINLCQKMSCKDIIVPKCGSRLSCKLKPCCRSKIKMTSNANLNLRSQNRPKHD